MSKPRSALPFWSLCALGLASAAIGASCSAGSGSGAAQFSTEGSGGSGAGTGSSSPTGSGTGGDNLGFGGGHFATSSGTGVIDPDGGCAGEATKAQLLPLDIFIMLDQSGSMTDPVAGGGNKWDAVTSALKTFVTQPGLNGIAVGIQYFGLPPGGGASCTAIFCQSDPDCGPMACGPCDPVFGICSGASGGDSCDPAVYAQPDVEIAPLPGVAAAIITSINAHMPTTSTPTAPALQGAINHAATWAGTHPGHVVIDVFATDGDPTECDTNLPNIAHVKAIAAAGANGTPKILTFVIGVGNSLTALNGIAASGGTGQAFIVDTTQNVNQQFLAALNTIRGTALGCQYKIPVPAMGLADYGKVNVQYTPGGGGPVQDFPKYQDKAHCPATGDGWYYDDNNNPTQILLCDPTCGKVSGDSTGTVNIVLGCQSIIPG